MDLLAEGERMPVYVHVIDHPAGRVLVDTGMTEPHPAVADMDPRLRPLSEQDFDLDGIDMVVNTHLHFDHCGGNHLFAGKPIYVQRQELDDARTQQDYTIPEWVDAPGVEYLPVDGELELLPGVRLVPAPATRAASRWSSSRLAGVRSSSLATWRSGSASSTSRRPKVSCSSAHSTPSSSGSRTQTSLGDARRSRPRTIPRFHLTFRSSGDNWTRDANMPTSLLVLRVLCRLVAPAVCIVAGGLADSAYSSATAFEAPMTGPGPRSRLHRPFLASLKRRTEPVARPPALFRELPER